MLSLSLDFYVNIAFPYYLSLFAFRLLEAESILVGRGDKICLLRSHQFLEPYRHGVFEDRES